MVFSVGDFITRILVIKTTKYVKHIQNLRDIVQEKRNKGYKGK